MPIARCDDHRPEPVAPDYVSYALPLGYPQTSTLCDVAGCSNPARLWLDADTRKAFVGGERVFALDGGAKVRVADDLFPN